MIFPLQSVVSKDYLFGSMETVKVPGQFESLPKIGEFVAEAAKQAELDDKSIYQVQLAVDEACSNIIDHAYGGENRGDIECSVLVSDEGLTVILRDSGKPFYPEDVPKPRLDAPLEQLKSRGVGFYLMQKMMDEISYERTSESSNVLVMVKRKH